MPVGPARMPLFDHLGELRMRLVRIVACLVVGVFVFFLASATIMDFMLLPISEFVPWDINGDPEWYSFGAFDAFTLRFTVSFWASLVATMPVILWQILAFFLPALKPNERKWFIPTVAAGVALFIFGTVFCYLVILHPAFGWLTDQATGMTTILPEAKSWFNLIVKFELGFGFAFELPLIVFYLVIFDVVPYKKLRGSWRTVYIALLVISAMVTPDASPVTMILMFAALVVLYEGSLLVSRLVLGKRIKKQNEKLAEEEAEEAAMEKAYQKEKAAKEKAKD